MSNIYEYIRVSSKDQNEDRQLIALNEIGVDRSIWIRNPAKTLTIRSTRSCSEN